jgi:hypothetical protein
MRRLLIARALTVLAWLGLAAREKAEQQRVRG